MEKKVKSYNKNKILNYVEIRSRAPVDLSYPR